MRKPERVRELETSAEQARLETGKATLRFASLVHGQVLLAPHRDAVGYRGEPPTIVWHNRECYRKVKKSASECLRAFLELADAPDSRVVEFVKTYGPLGVEAVCDDSLLPDGTRKWECSESVEVYRRYSHEAGAILSLACGLYNNEQTRRQDWIHLHPHRVDHSKDRNMQRMDVCDALTRWLVLSGVLPRLSWWDDEAPHLTLRLSQFPALWDAQQRPGYPVLPPTGTPKSVHRPSMLLAALAIQLTAILTSPIRRCSQCTKPFTPEKGQKRTDRGCYCSEVCRRAARSEDAARSRNKRKEREAQQKAIETEGGGNKEEIQ
jgi:hypothetical protein